MATSPRLSLCMIVRDSSRTLPACLASISPWVDELVVVDTGSTDDTRQIACRYGARVFDFPWCDDFSAARNQSLEHATGDWLFWMDSDDTISEHNGRQLRALADAPIDREATAYVMQVHCPGPPGTTDLTVVDHVKLFRNDPRLRFEGRIHEQILPAIRRIDGNIEWTDIFVTHSGSEHTTEAKHRKQQRDLRLLELELADRPEQTFVLFNLGMTYADIEQPERAVDYLKRSLIAASPAESHVRKTYALLVGCLTQMNKDEEASRILARGRELFPDDCELYFRLGVLEQRAERFKEAVEAYHGAINNCGVRHFASRDRGITGYKARHNLAGVHRAMGRLDLAELEWRLALAEEPNYRDGWCGLVDALLDQKKYVSLEVEIERAQRQGFAAGELACASAMLAMRNGELERAIEVLDTAMARDSGSIQSLRLKCQLLFEHGTCEEAIGCLDELCRRDPNDGGAWHNLGTAYQRSGCMALAISSYHKSLVVRPKSVPTLLQLGYAQHAMERAGAAKGTWEKALEIAPDDAAVRTAMGLVEEIAIAG